MYKNTAIETMNNAIMNLDVFKKFNGFVEKGETQ